MRAEMSGQAGHACYPDETSHASSKMNKRIVLFLFAFAAAALAEEPAPEKLPKGWEAGLAGGVNAGLAAKYTADAGLNRDPDVFCVEDFESDKINVPYKEGNQWTKLLEITHKTAFLGKGSGVHVWSEGDSGGACRYWFPKEAHAGEHPAYFMRVYRKFDRSWHPGDVSKAVGLKGMGICCLKAKFDGRGGVTAGGTCDGTNWYAVEDQFVGYAGKGAGSQDGYYWFGHLYSYMPFPKEVVARPGEIKINDPPATRFSCYADPKTFVSYDQWHCFEVGLYLNTPGKRNGEARYWIDGVLQARATKMCFRTVADALPEVATMNLYRTTEKFPQKMTLWLDNLVIARRYIGPAKEKEGK